MGKPVSSRNHASEAARPAALFGPPTAHPQVSPRHLGKLERALELVARAEPERDPPVLIWLCGPAGSGKRTLARTARERLGDQGIEFLVAEAHGATDEILEPVLGAARQLIGRLRQRELDGDRRWRELWRHILKRHAPALDRVLPEVDWGEEIVPYPDLDPEEERERLLDHLAGLFVRVGEHVPVVLQIDHADLLDAASRDLLLTLARVVRTRRQGLAAGLPLLPPPRLALLVTTLDEDQPPLPLDPDEVLPLTVTGLGREEFATVLAREYGEVPLSTREKLYQITAGNPLELEARQSMERSLRSADVEGNADRLLKLPGFELCLVQQLRELSPQQRALVEVLALCAKPTSAAILVCVVSGEPDPIDACLTNLVEAGWVARREDGACTLRHPCMVAPIAHELAADERARLHRRIAEAVEVTHVDRPCRRLQEVYYHYVRGPHDDAVITAGFRAAADAAHLYDFLRAIGIYQRLLECADEMQAEELVLGVTTLADLLVRDRGVDPDGQLLAFTEALLDEHAGLFPPVVSAGLWRRLGRIAACSDELDRELSAYEHALALLDGEGACTERLLVQASIARVFMRRREYDTSLEHCREGLQLREVGRLRDDPEFLELFRITEEAHFRRGELVEALGFEEEYLRLARVQGTPKEVLESLLRLAYLQECRDHPEAARESLLEATPVARATGSRVLEARIDERLGNHYARREDWGRARDAYQRALEVHAELGDEARAVRVFGALGLVSLFTGDAEGGARSFRLYALYQVARRRFDLAPQVPALPIDYRSRSERDEEIRVREESIARGASASLVTGELAELADLRRDCGELGVARHTLRRGLRMAAAEELETAPLHLRLSIVYRMQGEMDKSLDSLESGLAQVQELTRQREWLAQYSIEAGHLARAQGKYDRALAYLSRGMRCYLELEHESGVTWALIQIADLFRRLGKVDAAEELGMAALALADTLGVDRLEAEAWLLLGAVRSGGNGHTSGHQEVELAREVFHRLGLLEGRCRALLVEAAILLRWGDRQRVLILCGESLDIARDLGLRALLAEGLILRGRVEGDKRTKGGDFLRALNTLESALEHIRAIGDRELAIRAHAALAEIYEQRDRDGVVRTELGKIRKLLVEQLATCPREYQRALLLSVPGKDLLRQYSMSVAAPSSKVDSSIR